MKRILPLILCVFMLCSFAFSAHAAQDGSSEVKVRYNGQDVNGGELIAVRVGYADEEAGAFKRLTDDEVIPNIGKSSAVSAMEKYYKEAKDKSEFTVRKAQVKNGVAKFDDLTSGLYLIYQEKAASGYSKLSPFLVTVPYNGVYDVTLDAKSELERNPSPTRPPEEDPDDKLPQTGQLHWPVPVMAVSGVLFLLFGLVLCREPEREDYAD